MPTPTTTPPVAEPSAPIAKRVPYSYVVHGDTITDEYRWMRERDRDPDVMRYLEAENAYADAYLKRAIPVEKLYQELLSHVQETDLSVPYKKGAFFYYSRTEQGKQYPILCRKSGSLEAPEQVMLDLNELAKGQSFLQLGAAAVSDDGSTLAYSLDTRGFREYTLFVKDLASGKLGPERIEHTTSVAWVADGKSLFYVTEDHAKRPHRLWRHAVGTPGPDTLVQEEKDELFRLGVARSRSRQYLFAHTASATTSEVRFLRADQPAAPWQLIAPRRHDHEYDVDHHGDRFWIRTNSAGRNFRVVTVEVRDPAEARWREVLPHRADVMVEAVDLFARHLVRTERAGGLPRLVVQELASRAEHVIEMPEPVYDVALGVNAEFDTDVVRLDYTSLVTPPSVLDYAVATRERTLLKEQPVPGYDRSRYASARTFAVAPDGTRVPVSLVFRRGTPQDGSAPLLLYGYGAYGISMDDGFSSNRLALLDRGVIFAIAHVRGGGELGKPWHDAGRMLNKKNTFSDFVAAGEHLVAQRWTAPDRMAAMGGSAGGLLMGAIVNLRPDLWKAVVLQVPFVDVVNTMLDESLPLTVGEFEEWGNPKLEPEYRYLRAYCPYSNIAPRAYPSMLVKTGLHDSQVMYWEPAKYVARMRARRTDRNPLLFKTVMSGGHHGASGRYDSLRETAYVYAYVLDQLGRHE